MGRPFKPFKTDANSMKNVKDVANQAGFYKKDLQDGVYATKDQKYANWVKDLENEDSVKEKALGFLTRLEKKGGDEGKLATELKTIIGQFSEFEDKLHKASLDENQEESLKGIHDLATTLLRGEGGHNFGYVLYSLNQKSGGAHAKENDYKALYQMSAQLDRTLFAYQLAAMNQINESVEQREQNLRDCTNAIGDYNMRSLEFVSNTDPNSYFGKNLTDENDLDVRFNAKMEQLSDELKKAEGQKDAFLKEEEEKQTERVKFGSRLGDVKDDIKKAQKELEQAKADLDEKEETLTIRQREALSSFVSSLPDEHDVHNKEKADLIEQLDKAETAYSENKKAVEDAEMNFSITCFNYDGEMSRTQYNSKTNEDQAFFSHDDLENVLKMEVARNEVKRSRNNSSLDGDVFLSKQDTNAIIEALRTGEEGDIKDIPSNAMPYYAWAHKYATYYDLVYPDKPMEAIKGKAFFSYERTRSAGFKAAIDQLNATISGEKNPRPLPISQQLRNALETLDSFMAQKITSNEHIVEYRRLKAEKEAYAEKRQPEVSKMRADLNKQKEELEKLRVEIAEKLQAINQSDATYEDKSPEEKKNTNLGKAQAERDAAQETFNNAKKKLESLREQEKEFTEKRATAEEAEEKAHNNSLLAEAKIRDLNKEQIRVKEEYDNLKNKLKDLREFKTNCHKKVEELRANQEDICQSDERILEVQLKIMQFKDHVEDGNTYKNGKWDHKNGTHYAALKKNLMDLYDDLQSPYVHFTHEQLAERLTSLEHDAKAYLDTRASDWSFRLFGGSTFRYNRMNYANDIVNTIPLLRVSLLTDLKSTSKELEDEVKRPESEILPEPSYENVKRMMENGNRSLKLPDEQKEKDNVSVGSDVMLNLNPNPSEENEVRRPSINPDEVNMDDDAKSQDQFTVIDDVDFLELAKAQPMQGEQEKGVQYFEPVLEAGAESWSNRQDDIIDRDLENDEVVSENEENELVLGRNDNNSMTLNI